MLPSSGSSQAAMYAAHSLPFFPASLRSLACLHASLPPFTGWLAAVTSRFIAMQHQQALSSTQRRSYNRIRLLVNLCCG